MNFINIIIPTKFYTYKKIDNKISLINSKRISTKHEIFFKFPNSKKLRILKSE